MVQMQWSIYKDTNKPYEQWQESDSACYFDQDIVASPENRVKFFEDGIHQVWFENQSALIEVIDGKFNIEKAKEAIGEAVFLDGYWGRYIERFYRRNGRFEVAIGS